MKKLKNKIQEYIPDESNPERIFRGANTKLLLQILKKNINTKKIIIKELENRCLDKNGKWIGSN